MTPLPSLRSPSLLARGALLTLVLAGCASTAASHDAPTPAGPARTAVLAGPDARAGAIARAARTAAGAVEVRRVGGALEAQAQAAALAGEGYDTVVAVGAQARGAVSQAAGAEVGDGTRFAAAR
jgi:hypothetical protein